ncbi:MAG: hypothetical protein M1828_006176 [Chrysothrix sp. TS-e1954]|nr:MAG: hypothetical protein M1828_006176 [Chrysothrix sp. TS-e1954]
MVQIVQLALRGIQIAFAAIVLGLSESLVHGQIFGNAPGTTHVCSFNGAWGLFVAFIGIAAAFIEKIPGLVMIILDGIAVIFWLAGSIAMAAKLGVHSCDPNGDGQNIAKGANAYTQNNEVIDAGTYSRNGRDYVRRTVDFEGRCRMAQADDAFLFFGLACFTASLVLDFLSSRGRMMRVGGSKA